VQRTSLWLRVFVGLLLAILPPIILLLVAILATESIFGAQNANVVAVVVFLGALLWAAILAIVFTGGLADEFRSFLTVAERGESGGQAAGTAYEQLATSLDERNRQVATLAQQASVVPIDDRPQAVVASLVSAVRLVMRDPTWRCAVLTSEHAELLPVGIYHGADDELRTEALGDLERWASVTDAERPARHVVGPWGAFAVADIAVSDRLRAILYAPWEGRLDPTAAEIALLSLVGQHAGTALEHSLLYAQVRSQADELTRLAAVQADFLRGVTHDLQTPLTSIGALATELRANEAVPESARQDLDSITHQAERLRRMVGQLLVASRLEAGVFVPQQEVFAVRPLIERTWSALRADRPFELTDVGPAHLAVGDADRVEQVLWAILDNAVKYSPEASPIDVRISADDGKLAVTVRDRGAGMDAASLGRAFEQFYRSEQARKLAPDGSGVGLYAAHGLMNAMGGTIQIESALGRGTSVTVIIPAEPSAETAGD
jgi:signal transduction histidine kinase